MRVENPPTQQDRLGQMMYDALAQPIGLLVASPDVAKARSAFYAARNKINDPVLGQLQIRLIVMDGEPMLALVRSDQVLPLPAPVPGPVGKTLKVVEL